MASIDSTQIQIYDSQGLWQRLLDSGDQWFEAIEFTKKLAFSLFRDEIDNIVITGMGGAAITGDMIRSLCIDTAPFPVIINRSYTLPSFVNYKTLVLILSYSGDTEETVSAANHALERGARCIGITSGGYISTIEDENFETVILNKGLSSRGALAFFFVSLWRIFQKLEVFNAGDEELLNTGRFIQEQIDIFSNLDENEPAELAEDILDSLPVIYTSDGLLEPVNMRWRNQIQENAKTLAYGAIVPEMNHNEIVGWERTAHLMGKVSCIQLIDQNDHNRIKIRMSITETLIEPHAVTFRTIRSTGSTPLERMFYLILYGDFMSFYLAILSETDPAPITKIDLLKQRLREID